MNSHKLRGVKTTPLSSLPLGPIVIWDRLPFNGLELFCVAVIISLRRTRPPTLRLSFWPSVPVFHSAARVPHPKQRPSTYGNQKDPRFRQLNYLASVGSHLCFFPPSVLHSSSTLTSPQILYSFLFQPSQNISRPLPSFPSYPLPPIPIFTPEPSKFAARCFRRSPPPPASSASEASVYQGRCLLRSPVWRILREKTQRPLPLMYPIPFLHFLSSLVYAAPSLFTLSYVVDALPLFEISDPPQASTPSECPRQCLSAPQALAAPLVSRPLDPACQQRPRWRLPSRIPRGDPSPHTNLRQF
jgi:hypothetical protein